MNHKPLSFLAVYLLLMMHLNMVNQLAKHCGRELFRPGILANSFNEILSAHSRCFFPGKFKLRNRRLDNGSKNVQDYTGVLSDDRATWQRSWETEVGTVVQNNYETVTRTYVADYLSLANRDILVTEDGSWVSRIVYDKDGNRVSTEFDYADGTARGVKNAAGEYGENPASDFAVQEIEKIWYRSNLTDSSLFAVDADGEVVNHMIFDPWGNPLIETYVDANFSGIDNLNNYTGYTWDEVLSIYFAQTRFYDAANHRFTQEDSVKDGVNWYAYCENNPLTRTDPWGTVANGGGILPFLKHDWYNNVNNRKITQQALNYLGYTSGAGLPLQVDGILGHCTNEAIFQFQTDFNKRHPNMTSLDTDGLIGKNTWRALEYAVGKNERATTEGEHTYGNDTIKVHQKGKTITVTYRPKVFVRMQFYDEYCYMMIDSPASRSVYDTNVAAITEGFKMWNGTYENVQGSTVEFNVNVYPTQVSAASYANLIVTTNINAVSQVSSTWGNMILGSLGNSTPQMYLNFGGGYYSNSKYPYNKKYTAAHEFGHVLGLFDAYSYKGHLGCLGELVFPEARQSRVPNNGIMRDPSWPQSPPVIRGKDIEMVLYAWHENKIQFYENTPFGKESPAVRDIA